MPAKAGPEGLKRARVNPRTTFRWLSNRSSPVYH